MSSVAVSTGLTLKKDLENATGESLQPSWQQEVRQGPLVPFEITFQAA